MKRSLLPASFLSLLALSVAFVSPPDEHPSEASRVLATYAPERPEDAGAAQRAAAALAFLAALDDELRAQAALPLESAERQAWTNTPPRGPQGGARLGDLDEAQLQAACDLLAAALSPAGYVKVRDILLADDRLLNRGRPRPGFGAENFWLAVFGTPSTEGRWALQFDGHHLALNMSFAGDSVGISPTFVGTQPATYERGELTVEPMLGESESAVALMRSLSEEQRATAVLSARRGRMAAGAGRDGHIPEPVGLSCEQLDAPQRTLLLALLQVHIGLLPEPAASLRFAALQAEIDDMLLAWSGPIEVGADISYRIQGPSVLIEYACQDLGGDPLQHLHAIVRDPSNEYGVTLGEDD